MDGSSMLAVDKAVQEEGERLWRAFPLLDERRR
jgi:hypothetical protein